MTKKHLLVGIIILGIGLIVPLTLNAKSANPVVAQDQVIDDNYVNSGDSIVIDGTIKGDALLAGGQIIVNGHIEGDLIFIANSVLVSGTINGNIRGAAGDIIIRGSVAKNVTVAANSLEVTSNGQIGQSLAYAAGTINMSGIVVGNMTGQSFSLALGGQVSRDVNVSLSNGDLKIEPEGSIKGNLRYGSDITATIDASRVGGTIEYHKITDPVTGLKGLLKITTPLVTLLNYLALLLVGFVIYALFPRGCEHIHTAMLTRPMVKIGWGLAIFLIFPVLLVTLMITVIGIPLALIFIGLYLIALYLSPIFVGLAIGQYLFKLILPAKNIGSAIWLIVGLAIFTGTTWIPLIGWLVSLIGTVWFLGGVVLRKIASMKESRLVAPKP